MTSRTTVTPSRVFDLPVHYDRADPLPREEVSNYRSTIELALEAGELDDAFNSFQEWLQRENRYVRHGHASNAAELFATTLQLVDWMHKRVPRSMARVAAMAA